tara:strand:- start:1753 stop:2298 length:546 start_codon:yes stop_codon:yes gene_type:complete
MPRYNISRQEFSQFKEILEKALHEVRLPSGIIENDHIAPNSVNPSHCDLKAKWSFGSNFSSGGTSVSLMKRKLDSLSSRVLEAESSTESIVETDQKIKVGKEDVYFLDATVNKVVLTLPSLSTNVGRKIYVKRMDSNKNQICRVITAGKDELDGTCGIELNSKEAVILIASSKQWHVFSRL